jgi:hypothetical protein
MENFRLMNARDAAQSVNSLQAEWMAMQSVGCTFGQAARSDKRAAAGPGPDVAARLDQELRQFATAPQCNASADMKAFQKLVNDFEDAPDKRKAISTLGSEGSKIRVHLTNDASATAAEIKKEAAKVPGRKALESDFSNKELRFFNQVDRLSDSEKQRVLGLAQFQSGESREFRNARLRDGIQNNTKLLNSFNSMEEAHDRVEASKTPLEKSKERQLISDRSEIQTIQQILTKASIRANIKNSVH